MEDYYRREQLLGNLDSTISFVSRPLFSRSLSLSKGQPTNNSTSSHLPIFSFSLLPFTWTQQYNTHHPYSLNDGSMIPAKGYQTLVSGGFFTRFGPLSIQFKPELVWAENKRFSTFTDVQKQNGSALNAFAGFHGSIDLPEYFPGRPFKKILPGQSSIRLTIGPVSAGLSSENLWWGPGIRNALMISNSASGFYHLTLNTVKPIKTPIGSFEGQIIGGKLETSNFLGEDLYGNEVYSQGSDDWRYLNAMILSYQPRWVKGLFIGATRSFMIMNQDAKANNSYFRVLSPVSKKENYGEGESSYGEDQQITLFARWIFPADHMEIYGEFGRGDHNYDLRDMLLQPDHFRAYLIGFKKIFNYEKVRGKYVEFNLELTQLEQNTTNTDRPSIYYSAYGYPLKGNTNLGQMLGAGIGPGSNLQTASVSWGKGLKSLGFQLERNVHNNDLFYAAFKDIRAHWVDINLAALGQWDYKNFLLSTKLELIRSLNYEYNYEQIPSDSNQFWTPGRDTYNFQANLSVSYQF